MTFQLNIAELIVYMNIGVYSWEKVIKQKVKVSIEILHEKMEKGSFIDYAILSEKVTCFLTAKEFLLLEEAAGALLEFIAKEYVLVTDCKVTLSKYKSSIKKLRCVSVTSGWSRIDSDLCFLDKLT